MIHYFISDLHLSEKRLDLIQAFTSLANLIKLKHLETQNTQLHIVGDFYEAWIGDDFNPEWNNDIEKCLKSVSSSGCEVYVYHGNRDFLLGESWAKRVGATLVKENKLLEHQSKTIFVSHGDECCLDDIEYQNFRQMVRQKEWQDHVLSMPLEQRVALASQLREDSKQSNSGKMLEIMDVDLNEIDRLLVQNNASLMIHGHTHRPNQHTHTAGHRLVLGDWDKTAWLAILENKQISQYKVKLDAFNSTSLTELITKSDQTQSIKL